MQCSMSLCDKRKSIWKHISRPSVSFHHPYCYIMAQGWLFHFVYVSPVAFKCLPYTQMFCKTLFRKGEKIDGKCRQKYTFAHLRTHTPPLGCKDISSSTTMSHILCITISYMLCVCVCTNGTLTDFPIAAKYILTSFWRVCVCADKILFSFVCMCACLSAMKVCKCTCVSVNETSFVCA